jgi:hypothetical protein
MRRAGRGAVTINLDRQVLSKRCEACNTDFVVVRGSVFEEGKPVGLYLVALHGHSSKGRLAHIAIALIDAAQPGLPPVAVAVEVVAAPDEFRLALVDWNQSPWAAETYLGTMLDRAQALESPLKPLVFHVADHVIADIPEVQAYFS